MGVFVLRVPVVCGPEGKPEGEPSPFWGPMKRDTPVYEHLRLAANKTNQTMHIIGSPGIRRPRAVSENRTPAPCTSRPDVLKFQKGPLTQSRTMIGKRRTLSASSSKLSRISRGWTKPKRPSCCPNIWLCKSGSDVVSKRLCCLNAPKRCRIQGCPSFHETKHLLVAPLL